MTGSFCISIDVELAWGLRNPAASRLREYVLGSSRPIIRRLLADFDRLEVPATWAVVAQLMVRERNTDRAPGPEALWYAPEVVEAIRAARPGHEIASHSFSHPDFSTIDERAAAADLDAARAVHHERGLAFRTFVFPWNRVAHAGLLASRGVHLYRTLDAGLVGRVNGAPRVLRRAVNLIDKMLPLAPPTVVPAPDTNGLLALPGSMLLMGRGGARRLVRPAVLVGKAHKGLQAAAARDQCFHLWFHPSNFYFDPEAQFAALNEILEEATQLRREGRIDIRTLGSFDSSGLQASTAASDPAAHHQMDGGCQA